MHDDAYLSATQWQFAGPFAGLFWTELAMCFFSPIGVHSTKKLLA